MINMKSVLKKMESEWGEERIAVHNGQRIPFLLKCSFNSKNRVEGIGLNGFSIPQELFEFYEFSNGAELFADHKYGQWGLHIYDFEGAVNATKTYMEGRESEILYGDFIIGNFLGDSDLLLVRCDKESDDFGFVVVVNAIDYRSDWYLAAKNFFEFILNYSQEQGGKFWEISN